MLELVARQARRAIARPRSCAAQRGDARVAPRAPATAWRRAVRRSVRRRESNSWRSRDSASAGAAMSAGHATVLAIASSARARATRRRSASSLLAQHVERRVAAHVADDQQRIAAAHGLPLAHPHFAHDAAFLVLHDLAAELGLHLPARPPRRPTAAPRRTTAAISVAATASGSQHAAPHARAAAQCARRSALATRAATASDTVALGGAATSEWRSCVGSLRHLGRRVPAARTAQRMHRRAARAAPAPGRAGRAMSSAPSRSTASASAWRISAGRCDTSTTVVPACLSARERRGQRVLALGVEVARSARRAPPASARRTRRAPAPMRWRWPPDSTMPPSPISVS